MRHASVALGCSGFMELALHSPAVLILASCCSFPAASPRSLDCKLHLPRFLEARRTPCDHSSAGLNSCLFWLKRNPCGV